MNMPNNDTREDLPVRVARIIKWEIPLWGLMTALAAVVGLLMRMNFTIEQTAKDMVNLQANLTALQTSVAQSNAQVATLGSKTELHAFRLDTIDSDLRLLKQLAGDKTGARK